MLPELIIGTDLGQLLAPLDEVAPGLPIGEPSDATSECAYALLLLGCELSIHPQPSAYFFQICEVYGISREQALTIARAVSCMAQRVAFHVSSLSHLKG